MVNNFILRIRRVAEKNNSGEVYINFEYNPKNESLELNKNVFIQNSFKHFFDCLEEFLKDKKVNIFIYEEFKKELGLLGVLGREFAGSDEDYEKMFAENQEIWNSIVRGCYPLPRTHEDDVNDYKKSNKWSFSMEAFNNYLFSFWTAKIAVKNYKQK